MSECVFGGQLCPSAGSRCCWGGDPEPEGEACDHDGQLIEVPELGEVRCEGCGEMAPTVEKHLGA